VHTPGAATIQALCEVLQVAAADTGKAVFFVAPGKTEDDPAQVVIALVRGDMDVNEAKLANVGGYAALRPADADEIRAVGAIPGYASPLGVTNADVVVDDLIPLAGGLILGANRDGYHARGVQFQRDYAATRVADIVAAQDGDPCAVCGSPLAAGRGVEAANTFKLGRRYADAVGATFVDRAGKEQPVLMGSYGIGVGRTLQCIVEEHHDENGIVWPHTTAPYDVHVVQLPGAEEAASGLCSRIGAAGLDVLLDDRDERAGVKFADADLIGIPLRVTAGRRSIAAGTVELRWRASGETGELPLDAPAARWRSTFTENTAATAHANT
jgi:prolyl-tRNA synthetase